MNAGLRDDVDEVKAAIQSSPGPTVVVGWSYGCDVVGIAAHGMPHAARLVYASSVPLKIQPDVRDASYVDAMEHMLRDEHGRFVLDNDWWLHEDGGAQLPAEVRSYLESHPRRFVTPKTLTDPVTAAAWSEIPTTILLGTTDALTGTEQRTWAHEAVADVREVESDHFILFNCPDLLAEVILEELQ
jgi:pimeloyl-ACP methyl ester carboxylesterase